MTRWLWLVAGGIVGTGSRFVLTDAVSRWLGTGFPYGTLTVNTLGCLVMGCAATWVDRSAMSADMRLFLMTGGLGAFTTLSALIYDSWRLMERGQGVAAAINVVGTIGLGFLAFWLGSRLILALV